jgi:hypothetical protein
LVAVYQNTTYPLEIRLEAAKAAIAYEKPRLASIEHSGQTVRHVISDQPEMTPDEWKRKHCSDDPPTAR